MALMMGLMLESGKIMLYEYLPQPRNVTKPLTKHPTFEVSIGDTATKQLTVACIRHSSAHHTAKIEKIIGIPRTKWHISMVCNNSEHHLYRFQEEAEEDEDEDDRFFINVLVQLKYKTLQESYCFKHPLQLIPQPDISSIHAPSPLLVPPGYFIGTYGAHGIEILRLTYQDNKAIITKVTGDPNVPAGVVSIRADLDRPMLLTREQQTFLSNLQEIDTGELAPNISVNNLPPQPFVMPQGVYERFESTDYPNICRARFHSEGQIAQHRYQNPSFTKGHWIIFNDDMFAHIWLELSSLTMITIFHRVKLDNAILQMPSEQVPV